jgi:hypothetical protein
MRAQVNPAVSEHALPVWCACGRIVTYPGETRCEDCWADAQERLGFHGKVGRNSVSRVVTNINTINIPDPETRGGRPFTPVPTPPKQHGR